MNLEMLHEFMLTMPGTVEERPFTPEVPVYKVMGKMFAYVSPNKQPPWLTLKLDPAMGRLVRSTHRSVLPGYHMNKEHWNTIILDGSIAEGEILAWIEESYDLVVAGLTRKKKAELRRLTTK